MPNPVQQALRGEQALSPNRQGGYDTIAPPYARLHVVGLSVMELMSVWRSCDPYLAATATSAQIAPSADVQRHADAQEFQAIASQMDPAYAAADTAPQDVVDTAPAQPQLEQPRI